MRDGKTEAVAIVKVFPVVIPEHLLVKIAVKMERLNADVGSVKPALQEAPEVFESVGMDFPLYIGDRVIDDLVGILPF